MEQCDTLLARGGVGAEIHVRDHHVHAVLRQQRQTFVRHRRGQRANLVQRQQQRQRIAYRSLVVDDQYGAHEVLAMACIKMVPVRTMSCDDVMLTSVMAH
jgi:hypothetical protein